MHFLRKIPLFCSSYSALIIIAIALKINLETITVYGWIFLIFLIILIILGYYFLYNDIKYHSSGRVTHKICSIENKNDMMHTYLLPYLIFILTFFSPLGLGYGQIIALIIFFGYSYYKVTSETNSFVVISNVNLYEKINKELSFELIDENIFIYGG